MKKKKNITIYVLIILLLLCIEIFTIAYLQSKVNYLEKRNKFDLESFDYKYDGFGFDRISVFVDNNGDAYLKDTGHYGVIEEDRKNLYKTYTINTVVSSDSNFVISKTLTLKGYKFDIKNVTDLFGVLYEDDNCIFILKLSKNTFYYIDYLSVVYNHDYKLKKLNGLKNIVSIYNKKEKGIYAKNSSSKEIEISDYFTELYSD